MQSLNFLSLLFIPFSYDGVNAIFLVQKLYSPSNGKVTYVYRCMVPIPVEKLSWLVGPIKAVPDANTGPLTHFAESSEEISVKATTGGLHVAYKCA